MAHTGNALGESERRQLLVDLNGTQRRYEEGSRLLHDLFESQAARSPDALALVAEEGRLTYRELAERSRRLAHLLRRLGVAPDDRVGISAERSLDLVAGLLGILQAGAAYVPLDPDDPPERMGFMLQDASVSLLLTQERFLPRLADCGAEILCLDGDLPADELADAAGAELETGEDPPGEAPDPGEPGPYTVARTSVLVLRASSADGLKIDGLSVPSPHSRSVNVLTP